MREARGGEWAGPTSGPVTLRTNQRKNSASRSGERWCGRKGT